MAQTENKPTVFPADEFDPAKDADALSDAFKGFGISVFRVGTKDDVIISIFTGRSCDQRRKIQDIYNETYQKCLVDELHSELSGNYLQIMESMLDKPDQLRAKRIKKLIHTKVNLPGSLSTDVAVLEIIYPLTPAEINTLVIAYADAFQVNLIEDIDEKVDGDFKDTLKHILQNGRNIEEPSPSQIQSDAQLLSKLSPAEWSPHHPAFMKIFLSSSVYLFYLFTVIRANESKTLLEVAKTETNEKYRDGFVVMVNAADGSRRYVADLLYQSMKGLGTQDDRLIYLILAHCEKDLGNIEEEFLNKYEDSLQNFIRGDTSGDFQKALLALCGQETVPPIEKRGSVDSASPQGEENIPVEQQ
ncbi:annexin A13-like isoform X2 [Apostichopus japonicus]|uniref:annexin A13-like isoform X2 n=1 Tax=Stichopus japonicus TaxID=307972 RepID=UPI003AB65484